MSSLEERAERLKKSTETDQLKYEKMRQFATGEGERYEEGTLALLFLRCVRAGLQFFLSSNDVAGGKFDDIVLHWSNGDGSEVYALFGQLKHKTSETQKSIRKSDLIWSKKDNKKNKKKDNKDFSIVVYHESYTKIIDSLSGGSYALVLSTNLDLDKDAQHMFVRHDPESVPGMKLLESGGCLYRLNPNDDDVKSAVQEDVRFMQHFYLFASQSNSRSIKRWIYSELELLLGVEGSCCAVMCENLCSGVREWMNTQDVCLTSNWKSWLNVVDTYIERDVTCCNSVLTRIKYNCVETVEAHVRSCNPAWIRPPGEDGTALSATKVHQAVCGEEHIVVSVTRFTELEKKIMCCWGTFCPWLVLVDDAESSYETLLRMAQHAGPKRRLVVVSYKGDDSFPDTCKSDDIHEDSWKKFAGVTIKLNSEQYLCCLRDLCDTEGLKAMLDANPDALGALSQLSGPVRMGLDLDPPPVNLIPRELTYRMRIRQEVFSSLGHKDVCIMDEMSYKHFTNKAVLKNRIMFEELENYLTASNAAWPLFVVANNIDHTAVEMICSKYDDIHVYVLGYADNGWEIVFLRGGSGKIRPYVEEESRSLLKIVGGQSNRTVVEGKPGVGKSTMLVDLARQLKGQDPSWWILRIDLLKYSEVFDGCGSGVEASKDIFVRAVYNEKNLGILEHSLLQHCLVGYPRIVCLADGFDEVSPDYADICLEALQELAPRRGKLLVTTRPSMTTHLEAGLGVLAHLLPVFSEAEIQHFHGWSRSQTGVTDVVRDLLRIPLFSRMYRESLESGIVVDDIVSLYDSFFERKFIRLYEEKWGDNLSTAGKKKMVERVRREHEKQLGCLAVSHLLPRFEVPRLEQSSSIDRDDLVKAGVIYQFIDDKPVFIHRTFAEHFLAKWCFSCVADGLRADVYRKALSDSGLEFFVESFDRMASRGRPLLTAVLNGSKSEVKSLLEQGADPAEGDVMGRNSLHLGAAYSRDSAALQLLREIVEVARAVRAGGPAPGAAGTPQQAMEAEGVSEVGDEVRAVEEGRTVECGRVSCEAGSVEISSAAAGPTANEEMVATVDPLRYVEAMWGMEDELMHWTPLRYAAERRRWWAVIDLLDMGAELHHLGDFQRDQHDPEELWDIFNRYGYNALFHHVLDKKYKSMWSSQTVEELVEKHLEAGVSIVCAGMSLEQYDKILCEGAIFFNSEIVRLLMFKLLDMMRNSTTVESPALEMHQGASGRSRLDKSRRVPLREERFGNSALQQLTTPGDGVVRGSAVGEATLHEAARRGDCGRVRQLIEAGAGVNAQNDKGESAIHLAAKSGKVECIKLLHSAGADVSVRDKKGRTPLHCAAATGRAQTVKLLLEAGAGALAQDSECCTPLHVATIRRNADCVRLLAYAVENLESADANGFTALHYAARNGDEECLEHLLSAGAHHSPVSDTLDTPLHLAADRGNAECVRQLVQAEAGVTAKNADGFTALYLAGRSRNPDCLRHLLKGGADIREKDGFGRTPLHWAVKGGSPACVRVLLDEGADVDERDDNGATALHEAARTARPECVRELVGAEADVAARNADGKTALHLAAQSGYPGSVRHLLEAGADVQAKDDAGRTPLHSATKGGSPACARVLVEAGADTHQRDNNGRTPLQLAVGYSDNEHVKKIWDYALDLGDCSSSPGQAPNE